MPYFEKNGSVSLSLSISLSRHHADSTDNLLAENQSTIPSSVRKIAKLGQYQRLPGGLLEEKLSLI